MDTDHSGPLAAPTAAPDEQSVSLGSLNGEDAEKPVRPYSAAVEMLASSNSAATEEVDESRPRTCPFSAHGNKHPLEFTFWRRPKPRQWFTQIETTDETTGLPKTETVSSLSITEEHRPAPTNALVMDLVYVVLLVKFGAVFRKILFENPWQV